MFCCFFLNINASSLQKPGHEAARYIRTDEDVLHLILQTLHPTAAPSVTALENSHWQASKKQRKPQNKMNKWAR